MKLKKWTLAGLAVLLVAGGAPWGVGYVTEQHWREAALEVNRVQPFLNLETEQYRRGVLGSEVSASVTLRDPQTGDRHTIDLEVQVSHGVTGSLMVFRPRQGWQPEGADWFPDEEPSVTLETRIWGSATFELNAPVMTIDDPERESAIHTSGGLIRMDIGRLGDAAELLVVWPVIRLRDRDMDVVVENVHIEQSMEWLAGDIWTGSGAMTVGSLALKAPQAPELLLKGVSLETSSDAGPGGERLDSRMALSLESASMGGPSFGPHRLAVALEDLDVSSWNEFSAAMADMQSLALTAGDDPRVAFEQQMAVMQRFNEALRGLAAGGFSRWGPGL